MARYINPIKITSLINIAKIQYFSQNYENLLDEEYGLDDISNDVNLLGLIYLLIESLEFEISQDLYSDITYDLYIKLSKLINLYDYESVIPDLNLQSSTYNYIQNSVNSPLWGSIKGDILNQLDLIALLDAKKPELTEDIISNVSFGGTNAGTLFPVGMTFTEYVKKKEIILIRPTYIPPTVQILANVGNGDIYEVGTPLDIILNYIFNQNDAGALNSVTYTRNNISLPTNTETYNLPIGQTSYTVTASYAQGPIKNNSEGLPDATNMIVAGSIVASPINIYGAYLRLYGSGTALPTSLKPGSLNTFNNNFTINIQIGHNTIWFAYPATMPAITNSSVKYVEGFNSNVGDTFTESLVNVSDGGGNNIQYRLYTAIRPTSDNKLTYNVIL